MLPGIRTTDEEFTDPAVVALKWALFALKSEDQQWAEREIKQAISMLEEE
jgi:hypothetical protein